ncbi:MULTISPECIES: hypothetical protein [unclassified Acidovorax]|uniref:hypothetical protein n=1 Tax=unclassified Acidovorax TaxID=2684926 RepID=UPI0028834256|nr:MULTISPECIES: hypothetical protein [unclassified Acidovorax]
MASDSSRHHSSSEAALYLAFAALAALATWGPHVTQGADPHAFADQRTLWGLAHAMDVLTNLPFAVAGGIGLWAVCRWLARGANGQRNGQVVTAAMAGLFFAGLLLTAAGSSLYHWQPHGITLLADRAGMLVAFAGALGLAVASRIGTRAAWVTPGVVLVSGWLALRAWGLSGQLLPWGVLQGGGMLLMVWLATKPVLAGRLPVSLAALIGWYALAKVLELGDHAVWQASGGIVSGHSLKHVAAALAAWPVMAALLQPPAAVGTGHYWARCSRMAWRGRAAPGRGTIAAGAQEARSSHSFPSDRS